MSQRIYKIQTAWRLSLRPFRVLPETTQFMNRYCTFGGDEPRAIMGRKKFLVLAGPTCTGKTEYVRSLFPPNSVCELNCKNVRSVCLVGFDPEVHECIFWDEASPRLIADNRKVFQHPLVYVEIGHSPTAQHVKRVWLNDAVSIIASNDWEEELAKLSADAREWVLTNAVVVKVTSPLVPGGPVDEEG